MAHIGPLYVVLNSNEPIRIHEGEVLGLVKPNSDENGASAEGIKNAGGEQPYLGHRRPSRQRN